MKKRVNFLLLLFCALPLLRTFANNAPTNDLDINSPLKEDHHNFDDSLVMLISNMMNDFPQYSDEEYRERLQALSGLIDYRLDPLVKERIIVRTEQYRTSTEHLLGKGDIYFPIFEEHLAKYDIPHHLKYLSVIESHLNPVAKSVASAVGLWQFIPSSGKLFGLDINAYVDERSDTYKASDAAARLLRVLYDKYGDWSLAMAAYNCGPGRVDNAIKMAKGSTDYWVVRNFLPKETQKYVPFFMGMVYVGEYYQAHELVPEKMPQDLVLTDTIQIAGGIAMAELAKDLDLSFDTLKFLNPAYRRNYIPQSPKGQIIVLPARVVAQLRGYQNAYSRALNIQKDNPIRSVRRINTQQDLQWLCKAYRCRLEDILHWNELPNGYQPQAGDLIAIRKYAAAAEIVSMRKQKVIDNISMPALKVVALDPARKAKTAPVYMKSAKDVVAQAATAQPTKAASRHQIIAKDPAVASPEPKDLAGTDPNVPKAGSYESAGGRRISAAAAQGEPLAHNNSAPEDLNDRSRNRRVRHDAVETNVVSHSSDEPAMPIESSYSEQKIQKIVPQSEQHIPVAATLNTEGTSLVPSEKISTAPSSAAPEVTAPATNVESELTERSRARNLRTSVSTETANTTANNQPIPVQVVKAEKKTEPVQSSFSDSRYTYYKVQPGESIWDIKAKYPHVSIQELRDENNLRDDSELRAGTILKLHSAK